MLADVKVAVEEHVGSLPQRATVKPEHLGGLRQPQRHRQDGDFEAGKGQLLRPTLGTPAGRALDGDPTAFPSPSLPPVPRAITSAS